MLSQVELFLYSDKQGRLEEGRKIQRPKRNILIDHNKDDDNSLKNHNQIKLRLIGKEYHGLV